MSLLACGETMANRNDSTTTAKPLDVKPRGIRLPDEANVRALNNQTHTHRLTAASTHTLGTYTTHTLKDTHTQLLTNLFSYRDHTHTHSAHVHSFSLSLTHTHTHTC